MQQYNTRTFFYHGGEFPLTSLNFYTEQILSNILSKYWNCSVFFASVFVITIVQVSLVKDPDNIGKT